ncbi:hypothetical protein HN51_064851 [Arachis hypogaea]|uniref:BRCT domain-containing protein n=1 Tax=Arachis hypogaea TaxID=3818 RepID=A0A444ZC81_ARAHY|nr:uncharacterized protein LOC107638526 [Arachis ipaensis]XP_025645716.1 uncharacterized protein LOC112741098 [Arachis hypogaea]QHO05882.1 PAX-interacting protein [Arachis hypogaea]QHO05883.1 PAX-interacting protein [Arachis hypogaea]RYR11791.1 hypothetical protein Ahy_B04g069305 [Arachis hypogaea]
MASSREDKNKNNNTYSRDTSIHEEFDFLDTQPLDIPDSPSCDDESRYFEDTEPFDDCDDDNMEAEPMNLAGETQVLDFAGETQPLDDFDGAALVDDCTQLLNKEGDVGFESGGEGEVEGLDGTQVLEGVDDDADVSDGGDRQSAYNKQEEEHERFSDEKSFGNIDSIENELNSSGLKPPRFTYLRVESLRKAALAARDVASKKTSNGTSSDKGNSQSCQEHMVVKDNDESFPRCYGKVEEVNRECSGGKYSVEIEGQKNKNADKVASSAVRKLFNDALSIETNEPSLESNDFDGVDELPICHDGLSYVNSQEPGELSQLNALDFVDRFLHDNIMEFDQDTNRVKNTTRITTTMPFSANSAKNVEEKSKSVANGKGQQNLAKRVTDRGKDAKAAVFDWDDSREDEGGGDIYLRRKEDFFYCETRGSKSLPVSQKTKVYRPNNDKDAEEKLNIPSRKTRAVHSDSRLGRHNQRVWDNTVEEATRRITRNLAKELGEQLDPNCSRGEMEPKANADVREMMDVGLDTQMAAEAMEALCGAETLANDTICITRSSSKGQHNNSSAGKFGPVGSRDSSRQFDKKRKAEVKSDLQTSSLSKKCTEVGQCKKGNIVTRSKRTKLNAEAIQTSGANENGRRGVLSPMVDQRKSTGALKILDHGELKIHDRNDTESGRSRVNEKHLQDEVYHCTPIACRTRQSLTVNQFSGRIGSLEKTNGTGLHADESLDPNSTPKASTAAISNEIEMDTLDCPRRRRSLRIRKYSDHDKGSENLVDSSKSSVPPKGKSSAGNIHSRSPIDCNVIAEKDENLKSDGKNIAAVRLSSNNFEVTNSDESPKDCHKSSDLASATTPANCKTPMNDASPVCMGDDYYKQSCNRNLSRSCLHKVFRKELQRELRNLSPVSPELTTPSKDSRKRRDMTDVRILYSNHLNEDIIKHQKKILARLGVSVASSIADATHFIADQFVRTRNMLEAIAFGKPVVTHLWIESCGQASCFIDEKNYILRDAKKEKEFGFSMPVSLARASRHPLLEGRRVLITPNTKPSKEIISTLVRAVQGQAMERICRSVLKDNKILDDLLILSCEEDYASCVPFLEKGVMVYSSELLLNGIVIQKLDYERHCLFAEHVKKTRSTVWLRKDDRTFLPVTKCT